MVDVTTYSEARQNLARLMDRVVKESEPIIVARKKRGSVVLVSLAEWNSIQETLHLSSTRANARALMKAMDELEAGKGVEMTMKELKAFVSGRTLGRRTGRPSVKRKSLARAGKARLKAPKRAANRVHRAAAE
jgi:antitoxin YefM